MGTFGSIKAEVRTIIIDLPTAVTNLVPTLVQRAIDDLQTDHNFRVMDTAATFATVVGVRNLIPAVPADFKEHRRKPYRLEFTGNIQPVYVAPDRTSIITTSFPGNQIDDAANGFPQAILETAHSDTGARSFAVYPLPDGNSDYVDGEYRIVVPYRRILPALVADGDTNWFTVNAEQYIINRAASDGFAIDWDEERMAIWLQKAESMKAKVIKKDKLSRLAATEVLVPHWQGVNDTDMEW